MKMDSVDSEKKSAKLALLILSAIHITAILTIAFLPILRFVKVYVIILLISLLSSFCFFWANRESKIRLKNMLLTDDLTGLATLKKFRIEAEEILRNAKCNEFSLISLDINNFHYVSETLGQNKANLVLIEIANNFKSIKHENDIICRNFVDNFFVLTPFSSRIDLEEIVFSLTKQTDGIKTILPQHYLLEFSCGIYTIKNPREKIDSIIEKANKARLEGKKLYSSEKIFFYTDEIGRMTEAEKEMTLDMNRAFEDNEFVVYYQPKFKFSDNSIVGAEALIRWKHHEKGMLSPAYFIPLFERNGFIEKIDVMVFERVCKFLHEWNKSGKDGKCPAPITISCNLSRSELYDPNIAKRYAAIASQYEILPSKLELELTESMLTNDKGRLLKAMYEIKDAGFSISIDDFGSGYSSLNLLKSIPADVIKLDKEFFSQSENGEREQIIVKSIIDMSKKLKMTTVAEGIEDKEKSDLLKSMGCDIVQGYYYARPMPEDEYRELLHKLCG